MEISAIYDSSAHMYVSFSYPDSFGSRIFIMHQYAEVMQINQCKNSTDKYFYGQKFPIYCMSQECKGVSSASYSTHVSAHV